MPKYQKRSRFDVFATGAALIAIDEKLVAFRMSERRYKILKAIAAKRRKPIAVLINDTLDRALKLEHAAIRAERFAAVRNSVEQSETKFRPDEV